MSDGTRTTARLMRNGFASSSRARTRWRGQSRSLSRCCSCMLECLDSNLRARCSCHVGFFEHFMNFGGSVLPLFPCLALGLD